MRWLGQSRDILIENIRFFNSPMYHIKLSDVEGVEIRGISIDVDTTRQTEMLSEVPLPQKAQTCRFPQAADARGSGDELHVEQRKAYPSPQVSPWNPIAECLYAMNASRACGVAGLKPPLAALS